MNSPIYEGKIEVGMTLKVRNVPASEMRRLSDEFYGPGFNTSMTEKIGEYIKVTRLTMMDDEFHIEDGYGYFWHRCYIDPIQIQNNKFPEELFKL